MIVTGRFVFLHLHKSGGSFVNECLMKFVPDAQQVGYHLPRSLTPPAFAHLPALGFVRNPWSYYVSWFTFQQRRPQPNALFRVLSEDGRLDFEGTLRNLLDLGVGGAKLDALLAALPNTYANRGLNLPAFALERIRGSGLGFYSFLYRYLYDGAGLLNVGRMERLRDELIPMLVGVGQPVSKAMRAFIMDEPARNTSEHREYQDYYSDSLRDLIAERDDLIVSRYGYRFAAR